MERERMLSFLFVEEGIQAFHKEIVLWGIQPCFLHRGAHSLFWNTAKAANFLLNFLVHFVLYGQENYIFERSFFWTYKRFIDVL